MRFLLKLYVFLFLILKFLLSYILTFFFLFCPAGSANSVTGETKSLFTAARSVSCICRTVSLCVLCCLTVFISLSLFNFLPLLFPNDIKFYRVHFTLLKFSPKTNSAGPIFNMSSQFYGTPCFVFVGGKISFAPVSNFWRIRTSMNMPISKNIFPIFSKKNHQKTLTEIPG